MPDQPEPTTDDGRLITVTAPWVRDLYRSVQYTLEVHAEPRHVEWLVHDLHARLRKALRERSELEKRLAERDVTISGLRAHEDSRPCCPNCPGERLYLRLDDGRWECRTCPRIYSPLDAVRIGQGVEPRAARRCDDQPANPPLVSAGPTNCVLPPCHDGWHEMHSGERWLDPPANPRT